MAKVLILGDTHGEPHTHIEAVEYAAEHSIQHIFQVGDCGLFPAFPSTSLSIDMVSESLREHDVYAHWIRGNHDDTDAWQFFVDKFPDGKGRGMLRTNIRLYPRASYFKMFGLQWLQVGGAISIDRVDRLHRERETGSKTQYWPDEAISGDDLRLVDDRKVDILLTHDCSNKTPFGMRIKPDADSEQNRMKVDKILNRSRADLHFHGHMHEKYEWENYMVHQMNHSTMTYGLECNPNSWQPEPNNWVILDTDTKKVEWKL